MSADPDLRAAVEAVFSIDLDSYDDPEEEQIPPPGIRWLTPDGREPRPQGTPTGVTEEPQ
jgi:hypothetical protein